MYITDTNLYYVGIFLGKFSQLIYNFQLWKMNIQNKLYLIYIRCFSNNIVSNFYKFIKIDVKTFKLVVP